MQAYMKSEMPCRGVSAPIRRKAQNQLFRQHRLENKQSWKRSVLDLWDEAAFREERYAAIDLTGFRYYDQFQQPDLLPMYEHMIVTGAWWDYVDDLAARRVGTLLARFPDAIRPAMLEWSTSDDIWKRRTSILCQIKFKSETDLDLLYTCIQPSIDEKEFFLRKAIGWALRSYAWTDPVEVERYVQAHSDRLSGLSKREALKNLRA
jgi:3-methyladenine DNA glycosylase AlkD